MRLGHSDCRSEHFHILQINGIFQLQVSNAEKQTAIWTIDMKKTGTVYKGPAQTKADVTLILTDEVFTQLAEGKVQHGLSLIS
jgi:hypothetical protein